MLTRSYLKVHLPFGRPVHNTKRATLSEVSTSATGTTFSVRPPSKQGCLCRRGRFHLVDLIQRACVHCSQSLSSLQTCRLHWDRSVLRILFLPVHFGCFFFFFNQRSYDVILITCGVTYRIERFWVSQTWKFVKDFIS